MTSFLPSIQLTMGDGYLDKACNLRDQWKNILSPSDFVALENRIIMAHDMRSGLGKKNGLFKIPHARTYSKLSKEIFYFAKTTSERARDVAAQAHTHEEYDNLKQQQRVTNIAKATYRCFFSCRDAFPTADEESYWARSVWNLACMKTGTETTPPPNLAEQLATIGPGFHATAKEKIKPLVERHYRFETSKDPESLSRNIEWAQQLKINAAFSNDDEGHPYRHLIIQKAINAIWFSDRSSDGVVFSDVFDPMPYEVIALVLTVIECCIDEWSEGSWSEVPFTHEGYEEVYCHHLGALNAYSYQALDSENPDPLDSLRRDLLDKGRDHAGVPRLSRSEELVWPSDSVSAAYAL